MIIEAIKGITVSLDNSSYGVSRNIDSFLVVLMRRVIVFQRNWYVRGGGVCFGTLHIHLC